MKSVYEASTSLDAHMILNLLQQEGIDGRVEGEYLQGGVGDIQAINIVRVVVPEDIAIAARKIISDWEAKQPEPAIEGKQKVRASNGFLKFIIGLAVGIGGMYWANTTPITYDGIDYNNDGVIDEKWTYKNDLITKTEVDRNFDGKVDVIHYYNRNSMIDYSEVDDNFDGIFETKLEYENGNVSRAESDLNDDGKIDFRVDYEYGVMSRVEITRGGYGFPKKLQIYKMNKLVSAEYDSDGDGIYEQQYEYDFFEEPIEKFNKEN